MTLLALLLALAGCGTTGGVRPPSGPELVAAEKALLIPPPGGPAIVGVVQSSHANGVEQTISLATTSRVPGQNYFKVTFNGGRQAGEPTDLAYRSVSETAIRREMAAAVPGVRLNRSSLYLQNAYGPFGYASGLSLAGDACLYGWQQIRSRSTGSGIGRDFGMIQVRLRLCDSRSTENELLSVLYGYTIVGTFQGEIWNPYGSPGPVDPRLGLTGQPIYPTPNVTARNLAFGYSTADLMATSSIRPGPAAPGPATPVPAAAAAQSRMDLDKVTANQATLSAPNTTIGAAVRVPAPPSFGSETAPGGNTTAITVPSPECLGSAAGKSSACNNKGSGIPAP
ncbi:cellulose biosynthesis protein BcsN [Rhizobium helianthi]|uniref:cellulose biosynthesis protein BcsN n=1 Tax=Rhizobium helianthi TaxID=1132695 RepID=UPI00366C80B7